MNIESEVKIAVNMLHTLIEGNYVDPYNIVEMMSPELRDWLGDALWQYSANMDAMTQEKTEGIFEFMKDELGVLNAFKQEKDPWSEAQMITEGDYHGDLILNHLTSYKERMDKGEVSKDEVVQSLQRAGIMDEHGKVKKLVDE